MHAVMFSQEDEDEEDDTVIPDWQSSEEENELLESSDEDIDLEDMEPSSVEDAQQAIQHIIEVCNQSETDIVKSVPLMHIQSFIAKLKHFIDSNTASKKTSASQAKVFGQIFQHFHSKTYKQQLKKLFDTDSLHLSHFQIGYRLSMHVHEHTLIQNPAAPQTSSNTNRKLNNLDKHDTACAKVRYVGGSVIGRLMYRVGRKTDQQIQNDNKHATKNAFIYKVLKNLAGDASIFQTSKYQNSLTEIRDKMHGALTLLSDEAYIFFVTLEKKSLQLLNEGAVAEEGSRMAGQTIRCLADDEDVMVAWNKAVESMTNKRCL